MTHEFQRAAQPRTSINAVVLTALMGTVIVLLGILSFSSYSLI